MVQFTSVLLLVGACFSLASAQCDDNIISKILQLRKGKDDSKVMKVVGQHDVVYVSQASSVPVGFDNQTCVSATYYTKDGKYQADHSGLIKGTYILQWEEDHQISLDPETGEVLRRIYVVSTHKNYSIASYYLCSVSGTDVSLGSVAVADEILNAPKNAKPIAHAVKALAGIGLGVGETLTGCYNS